jgi:type II secretory pathway pseudopilin PulG
MNSRYRNVVGFTVIEIIMVILLISIMTAVIIPRFADYGIINLSNAVVKIATDIRYAQNRATTTHQRNRIKFATSTTYDLEYCATYSACNCTSGWAAGILQVDLGSDFSGVVLGAAVVGDCVEFDPLGRPYFNDGCANPGPCAASTGASVVVNSGPDNRTVSVNQDTGMVSY